MKRPKGMLKGAGFRVDMGPPDWLGDRRGRDPTIDCAGAARLWTSAGSAATHLHQRPETVHSHWARL